MPSKSKEELPNSKISRKFVGKNKEFAMETTKTRSKKQAVKAEKQNEVLEQKPKSRMILFREKYPNGYAGGCDILNMRAVLK